MWTDGSCCATSPSARKLYRDTMCKILHIDNESAMCHPPA